METEPDATFNVPHLCGKNQCFEPSAAGKSCGASRTFSTWFKESDAVDACLRDEGGKGERCACINVASNVVDETINGIVQVSSK